MKVNLRSVKDVTIVSKFTKGEIDNILKPQIKANALKNNVLLTPSDCRMQVIQTAGIGLFELIMSQIGERKSKFGLLKILSIGKAVIKIVENCVTQYKLCSEQIIK